MNKNQKIAIACVIVITLIFASIFIISNKKHYITFKELGDDYDDSNNNFRTYNVGDVAYVKDTITIIDLASTGNGTDISFKSLLTATGSPSVILILDFDLTQNYHAGDEVIIKIHIVSQNNGESWHVNIDDFSLAS